MIVPSIYQRYNVLRAKFRYHLQKAARAYSVRSSLAAALYYGFWNKAHMREIRAVAAGQSRYAQDHKGDAQSYYLLRRNIHRLEKGLIMRPRRSVFAADFIDETVSIYERALKAGQGDWNDELLWAYDVLEEYFSVVDTRHPKLANASARFVLMQGSGPPEVQEKRVPYARDLSKLASVDITQMEELAKRRRSVRWYLDNPVPRNLIDRALAVAAQAPSACNRQPFSFRIFDRPEEAARIASIPMGAKGFAHALPAIAVVVGQLRAYPYERDRHVIYIDGSLAAMSFMFALEALGLSSCPINWPDQEPQESQMKAALQLEDDERVVMLIGFGWPDPDGKVPRSTKRPVETMRVYE